MAEPRSIQGDAIQVTRKKYFKEAPDPAREEGRHIAAFVRGYLDADGAKCRHPASRNSHESIQATGDVSIEFIRKVFPVAGVYLFSEKDYTGQATNYGVRPKTVRFQLAHHIAPNTPYRLVSVDWANPITEEVWCLEVEEDQSFVLPSGIVTGNCTKKFSRSHAHLFHFVKDPKCFTFNSLDIRVPSARQLVYADARADSRGRLPDDTWILRPQDLPDGFQPEEDTWYFSRVCGTFKERAGWHGCQMPEQLLGRIIRACSNPDDLVLDPFAGSGTTLVVAKKLGRRWMGFELSQNYAGQAQARLDATSDGQPLEGAEEPKVSAPSTAAGKKLKK